MFHFRLVCLCRHPVKILYNFNTSSRWRIILNHPRTLPIPSSCLFLCSPNRYETFEKDPVKYAQYCEAIRQVPWRLIDNSIHLLLWRHMFLSISSPGPAGSMCRVTKVRGHGGWGRTGSFGKGTSHFIGITVISLRYGRPWKLRRKPSDKLKSTPSRKIRTQLYDKNK